VILRVGVVGSTVILLIVMNQKSVSQRLGVYSTIMVQTLRGLCLVPNKRLGHEILFQR
jgi:uncharacterized membrane protein YwaF